MYEHFKGEEVFVKKVLEYKEQVLYKQRLVCTKFLNPYHRSIVYSIIGKDDDIQISQDGGIENSESKKMILAPSFYTIEPEDFNLVVMEIRYAKHFDTLNHRDILGALMSLGIKRELFGDIVPFDDSFYVAVDKSIFPYVKEQLIKIKRSTIHISQTDKKVEHIQDYTSKSFIVSSLRLDKVISSFYKISRSDAAKYIQSGFVKVNHKVVVEINYLCNNSDIISLKKHGRVQFVNTNRLTKANNYVIEGYFYK